MKLSKSQTQHKTSLSETLPVIAFAELCLQ